VVAVVLDFASEPVPLLADPRRGNNGIVRGVLRSNPEVDMLCRWEKSSSQLKHVVRLASASITK
jgi:hypothetical protein